MAALGHPDAIKYSAQSIGSADFTDFFVNTAGHNVVTIALKNNGGSALAGLQLVGYAGQDTSSINATIATTDGDFTINNSTGLVKFTTSANPTTLASGATFMMGMDCQFFGGFKLRVKSAGASSVDLLFYLN